MSGMDCLMDMAYSNGASIVSEDEKTVTFNSDKFVEALETARQWINEEKSWVFISVEMDGSIGIKPLMM